MTMPRRPDQQFNAPAMVVSAGGSARGGPNLAGVHVTFAAAPPASPHVGDLWYDSSHGYRLNQWNGSAWVPFQYGTDAISAGSITAGLLAAGIIYAGIVDATTITGATLIADGSSGQFLVYSGTPAAGNLVASISGAAGSDGHTNPFLAGVELFGTSQLFALSTKDAAESDPAFLSVFINGSGGTRTAGVSLSPPNIGGGSQDIEVFGQSHDGSVPSIVQLGSGLLAFAEGGVPPAAALTAYPGLEWLFGGADGIMGQLTAAGLALNLSGSQLAQTAPFTVNTTGVKSLGFMTVNGGDVVAGATYTIYASGVATQGTTPSSAEFYVYWGGIAGTQIVTLTLPTITAGIGPFGWIVTAEVDWISATECEATIVVHWRAGGAGVTNSVTWHGEADTTGLDTSVNKNLALAFSWGSVPGATALTCRSLRFARPA